MKLLTLFISARAYGVTSLLELVILEQLTKQENAGGVSFVHLARILDEDFDTIAMEAAHLEELGLVKTFRGAARTVLGGMTLALTYKGIHLMFGGQEKPAPTTKQLGLRLTR